MEPEVSHLIAALHREMEGVNMSIGDLVDRVDTQGAKQTLEGVRRCMMTINQLYGVVDMAAVNRETDLIDRCHHSMDQCQANLEKVFGPFSIGMPVDQEDLRRFALDWMGFHQTHVELTDYIQEH